MPNTFVALLANQITRLIKLVKAKNKSARLAPVPQKTLFTETQEGGQTFYHAFANGCEMLLTKAAHPAHRISLEKKGARLCLCPAGQPIYLKKIPLNNFWGAPAHIKQEGSAQNPVLCVCYEGILPGVSLSCYAEGNKLTCRILVENPSFSGCTWELAFQNLCMAKKEGSALFSPPETPGSPVFTLLPVQAADARGNALQITKATVSQFTQSGLLDIAFAKDWQKTVEFFPVTITLSVQF